LIQRWIEGATKQVGVKVADQNNHHILFSWVVVVPNKEQAAGANNEGVVGVNTEEVAANHKDAAVNNTKAANNMGLPTNVIGPLVQSFMSQVLGDAFHVMHHIIVPPNHDFKASFFRASQGATFLMDYGDAARVNRVLQHKVKKLSHVLDFECPYLATHIKRTIPPPAALYARMKDVFFGVPT
jgi:hypothetical protein